MMPSARLFNVSVTVRVFTYANVAGRKSRSATDTTMKAAVQPRSSRRLTGQGETQGETTHVVYFATDPGVRADDHILWGSQILAVQSPANDQSGKGRVWAVNCREVA